MLGKRPDAVVARMVGPDAGAVQLKRHFPQIPPRWEKRRIWTANEDTLLGTLPDAELAKKLNRTVSSVRSRRQKRPKSFGSSRLRNGGNRLKCACLGRMPDRETARRTGRLLIAVQRKRSKRRDSAL